MLICGGTYVAFLRNRKLRMMGLNYYGQTTAPTKANETLILQVSLGNVTSGLLLNDDS